MPQFVIHSSAKDHLGCFHLLTIINNADMNMAGQMSVRVPAFLCFTYIPRSGIVVIFHIFWSISKKVADIQSFYPSTSSNIHPLYRCLFFSFTSLIYTILWVLIKACICITQTPLSYGTSPSLQKFPSCYKVFVKGHWRDFSIALGSAGKVASL